MKATNAMADLSFNVSIELACAEKLYLKEESADVHFLVNGNDLVERIPAHKVLLAVASDTFGRMFYGGLKEGDEVKIVDASASAFKEFLQCFYLKKMKVTMENVAEVIYLSEKYHVDKCKAACTLAKQTVSR